ncbi:hypothetical protein ILYODFUR_016104 [Ilyodon furcidens]|uniref:Secreted protein n=1 Tax=Ilyodon furcidens TaxID=33524 RepID=A0ABV0TWU2_9TELE
MFSASLLAFCLAPRCRFWSKTSLLFHYLLFSSIPGNVCRVSFQKKQKKNKVGEPSLCKNLIPPGVIISSCSSIKEQRFKKTKKRMKLFGSQNLFNVGFC